MAFNPTTEQGYAIDADGQILVSAAAGSGKTAVLVEKIAQMITQKDISPDRIMVVTFTNAAAAEIRSRIDVALQKIARENGDNLKLQKRIMLLGNAYIGTTDSICLRLVRENFELLGVSPAVKVIDPIDFDSLKRKALADIFKERYSANDKELHSILRLFPGDIDDTNTKNVLLDFYELVSYQISRENYLNSIHKMYDEPNFMYWLKKYSSSYINRLQAIIDNIGSFVEKLPEDSKLVVAINEIVGFAGEIVDALYSNNYEHIYNALRAEFKVSFPTASKKAPQETLSIVKSNKKALDAIVKELKKIYHLDVLSTVESFELCKVAAQGITNIMQEFITRVDSALIERGLISFELCQRLALKLLREFDGENIVVPDSAKIITDKFDCVMVDEYQDTNNLQDFFFKAISDNGKKLFTVGDMKQSIYRFRGANPENFKKKQTDFADYLGNDNSVPRKIFLNKNFRSREEICDFINYFFYNRMTEKVGSIDYSENEKLNFGAEYYNPNDDIKTDIVLLNYQGNITRTEHEARYIAKYIIETMKKPAFLNDGENGLRKADYKDFAVFLRTGKGNIDLFAKILAEYNIPFSIPGEAPLLSSEVVTVVSLLRLLSSKNNDIAFVSAFVSPLFGFSLEEVAELKMLEKRCLFDALIFSSKTNEKHKKAVDFINKLKHLSTSVSVGELVYTILNLTSFKEIVSSMSNSAVRLDNLSLLEEMAFSFVKDDNYSLAAFISYYDKIASSIGSDSTPDKNENTVKIMTMHKSKGLQYPICIIALNTKRFSDKESKKSFLASEKNGVGFKYFDNKSSNIVTPAFEAILKEDRAEQISEEMRVYYVALTRAEEKLVILLADNYEKNLSEEKFILSNTEVSSFSDWVYDAAFSSPSSNNVRALFGLPLIDGIDNKLFNLIYEHANGEDRLDIDFQEDELDPQDFNADEYEKICKKLNYQYPYEDLRQLVAKTSVSSLVHKSNKYANSFLAKPSFAENDGLSSAEKGTALHKFMQFVDFGAANVDLNAEIERLYEYKFLSAEEVKSLNKEQIDAFLDSPLLKRAMKSQKIYREYKFISEIPAAMVNNELPKSLKNQTIIIQGAVDCMFIENNELVIIDFKTDRMNNETDFIDVYKEQLDYYSLACEKIFKIPVKERFIYSLHLGKTIKL